MWAEFRNRGSYTKQYLEIIIAAGVCYADGPQ